MTLQQKLQDSASAMGVPTTDVSSIIHTAQVRQKRRKAGVAVAAVGMIVTAGVAVRELADVRSDNQELGVGQPIDAPTDSGATPAPASDAAAAAPQQGTMNDNGSLVIPNATPAVPTDPQMQWVVVPADSPQALAARFDNTQRYAISTGPSNPDTGEAGPRQLFEYTDGSWSEVPFSVPDDVRSVVPSGDYVYGVSTAPAVAGGRLGTLGTYDPSTTEWDMTPLPDQAVGYLSERVVSNVDYSVTAIDGGVLVAADAAGGHLRWDAFPELSDRNGEWGSFDWNADGTVVSYENCDDTAVNEAMAEVDKAAAEATATTTVLDTVPGGVYSSVADYCEKRVYQPAEVGLTDADQQALAAGSRFSLWRITNGEATAVELPQPNALRGSVYQGILNLQLGDGAFAQYRVEKDGSFTPVFADLPADSCDYNGNVPIGCLVEGAVATPSGAATTAESYLLTSNVGTGSTTITDLAPLFADVGANPRPYIIGGGAVGDVFVGAAEVRYDPPNVVPLDGSVSSSGYSLRSVNGSVEVIDEATGDPMDLYDLSTESGKVEVWVGGAGGPLGASTVPVTTAPPSEVDSSIPEEYARDGKKITFDVDWQTVSGLNSMSRSWLYTTIDGVHVSLVDPLQVAGLPADTRYNTSYPTVSANQVTADIDFDDGTRMMLIGTPIQ